MIFEKTDTWKINRLDFTPTIVSLWENKSEDIGYLSTTILLKPCDIITIIIAEVDDCLWEIEWQIDFDSLSEKQKIDLYNKSIKPLLDIIIWLKYPDTISKITKSNLNWLKSLRKALNGPKIPEIEKRYENDFLFLIQNEQYNMSVSTGNKNYDFSNLRGWLPRGKSVILSTEKTVKYSENLNNNNWIYGPKVDEINVYDNKNIKKTIINI